jgi:hypothetical protein
MQVGITVNAADSDDRTAELTRELLKDIRSDADPRAYLPTKNASPGSKGDLAILGEIALALVSGGAVTKFIQAMFGFLGRHRKIEIEVQNSSGKKLKLKWDYVDRNGEDKAIDLVGRFLTKSA